MPKSLPILGKILPKENLDQEPLLALEISEEKKIKAAIWQVKEEKYKILKKAVEKYEEDWEEAVSRISQLISKLVKEIGFKRVKKVIFGLPKSFLEREKIKQPYLSHLKTLSFKLSLTPLGFVETPQSIAFLLKEKEGHPQTIILLKVTSSYFTFNIFQLGKELISKTVPHKENIALELSQALKEISETQTFPTQIVLYDEGKNLEEVKQELLSYSWQKESGFLHFPRIEILDEDFSLEALVAAGASELAKEILEIPKKEEVASYELGFLKEEDVAEKEPLPPPKEKRRIVEEEKVGEVREEKEKFKVEADEEVLEPRFDLLPSLIQILRSLSSKIRLKPNFRRIIPILIVLGVFFGVGIFYSFWYLPQATVKLFVEPYSLEKDAEIILNLSLQVPEEDSSQLPGREVVVEWRGSEKIAVATKKEIGEAARGEVTIYNKTTNAKPFSKGTVIAGPKGLKFTLDTDVKVASLSDVIAGTPGKEKVKVTATQIGPEGNLGAGSDFTFKDFPVTSYAARNEEAFSGGTSREITVVGKEDQEKLLDLLKTKLTSEAKEELEKNLRPSERLLPETIEGKILEKKFDHEVGDETDELTLDLKMSFQGISFSEEDLSRLVQKMAEEAAPSGFKFDKEEVEMEVTSTKREKDEISFNAHFKVKLIPEIDEEELKEKLVRKKVKEVNEYLRTLPSISGFEVKFVSYPPFMGKTLPFNSQKISIEIRPL